MRRLAQDSIWEAGGFMRIKLKMALLIQDSAESNHSGRSLDERRMCKRASQGQPLKALSAPRLLALCTVRARKLNLRTWAVEMLSRHNSKPVPLKYSVVRPTLYRPLQES